MEVLANLIITKFERLPHVFKISGKDAKNFHFKKHLGWKNSLKWEDISVDIRNTKNVIVGVVCYTFLKNRII